VSGDLGVSSGCDLPPAGLMIRWGIIPNILGITLIIMIIYNDLICGDYTDYNDQNMIQFLGILTITNQYHGKYHNILGIIKYQYYGMIEGF
jgi:hypothetical protein